MCRATVFSEIQTHRVLLIGTLLLNPLVGVKLRGYLKQLLEARHLEPATLSPLDRLLQLIEGKTLEGPL
jgi:hypothetical protein